MLGTGRIIPAYAGSTFSPICTREKSRDHPRIRGEHFRPVERVAPGPGSSPHTRGALLLARLGRILERIIPAYAGSTSFHLFLSGSHSDHPRIRGEHGWPAHHIKPTMGSSPHTRGAHLGRLDGENERGIIPAYAGSTRRSTSTWRALTDHPRIRGEHSVCAFLAFVLMGSSPHTRGARTAWAAPEISAADHPRIRGEHYLPKEADIFEGGSSPHTRGARLRPQRRHTEARIIPAYAGSTSAALRLSRSSQDHPRIRGEHNPHLNTAKGSGGSSPHTRGAPPNGMTPKGISRIIPAYAGSTCR